MKTYSDPELLVFLKEGDDDQSVELRELKAIIARFTGHLPGRCREIYNLSRNEHLNNKEIAARMGISEKTVEAQLTKALRQLRTRLGHLNF